MRAISIPGLKPAQRIEVTAQGAIVFRRAGLRRKYGLLMYMASLMSAENDDPQVRVTVRTVVFFGIGLKFYHTMIIKLKI
jgi:hypothetical protein